MSPPPSPLSASTPPLPTLSTHPTTSPSSQTSALKLIADSIAQQRQLAARALLTHPLSLSFFVLLLACFFSFFILADDNNVSFDKTLLFTTAAGVVMLGLVGVRAFTGVYLVRAEGVGWGWLYEGIKKGKMEDVRMGMEVRGERNREGEEEEKEKVEMENDDDDEVVVVVVVTVWDERVIATVVLNVDRLQRKGMVRAWTTMLKYRGAGVGRGVLEEAVRVAVREYGCRKVEFGKDHANSKHILPALFNHDFLRRESRARHLLAEILESELGSHADADGDGGERLGLDLRDGARKRKRKRAG